LVKGVSIRDLELGAKLGRRQPGVFNSQTRHDSCLSEGVKVFVVDFRRLHGGHSSVRAFLFNEDVFDAFSLHAREDCLVIENALADFASTVEPKAATTAARTGNSRRLIEGMVFHLAERLGGLYHPISRASKVDGGNSRLHGGGAQFNG
jgi:hypothetical protein